MRGPFSSPASAEGCFRIIWLDFVHPAGIAKPVMLWSGEGFALESRHKAGFYNARYAGRRHPVPALAQKRHNRPVPAQPAPCN